MWCCVSFEVFSDHPAAEQTAAEIKWPAQVTQHAHARARIYPDSTLLPTQESPGHPLCSQPSVGSWTLWPGSLGCPSPTLPSGGRTGIPPGWTALPKQTPLRCPRHRLSQSHLSCLHGLAYGALCFPLCFDPGYTDSGSHDDQAVLGCHTWARLPCVLAHLYLSQSQEAPPLFAAQVSGDSVLGRDTHLPTPSVSLKVGFGPPFPEGLIFALSLPSLSPSFWSSEVHTFPKQDPDINSSSLNALPYDFLTPWLNCSHKMTFSQQILLNPTPKPESSSPVKYFLSVLHFFLG